VRSSFKGRFYVLDKLRSFVNRKLACLLFLFLISSLGLMAVLPVSASGDYWTAKTPTPFYAGILPGAVKLPKTKAIAKIPTTTTYGSQHSLAHIKLP
jgi:hypothetical protein